MFKKISKILTITSIIFNLQLFCLDRSYIETPSQRLLAESIYIYFNIHTQDLSHEKMVEFLQRLPSFNVLFPSNLFSMEINRETAEKIIKRCSSISIKALLPSNNELVRLEHFRYTVKQILKIILEIQKEQSSFCIIL